MRNFHQTFALSAAALWTCMAATSYGQLSIHYDFTSGSIVTDANGQLSIVKTLGGLSGLSTVDDVDARLNLTTGTAGNPMFLGDLYSSLTFGNTSETQRTAVLLNRAGRDNTNAFGSSLSSLNVTLDDGAATNVWATTSSTGTYQADGRLSADPNAAGVAFAAGSNGLTALNGSPLASNRVSLLVADYSTGGVATLTSWGFSATGVAASTGTFTPGANATLSDTGSGDTNTIGAILNVTGATGGSMQMNFAGTTTFSNGVTGTAGITKLGGGTVILEGASDYTGATSVNAGKLLINGNVSTSSFTTVASLATVGGTGSMTGLTVQSGGFVAPGDAAANSTGALTVNGNYTQAGTFNANLNGTTAGSGYDQIIVVGAVDITGGALAATFSGFTPVYGDMMFILLNDEMDAITGTYAGYAQGAVVSNYGGLDWQISYEANSGSNAFLGGNDIALVAIPEPSIALLGSLSLLGLALRRRR